MIENIIFAVPFIIGLLLVMTGVGMKLYRRKNGVITQGVVTGIAKMPGKVARVAVEKTAPVVKYTFGGKDFCGVCAKFYPEGQMEFKKGKNILIRVSRKNPARFMPAESGSIIELMLIGCGVCIVLAYVIILLRYGL